MKHEDFDITPVQEPSLLNAKKGLVAIAVETIFLIGVMAAVPLLVYLDAVVLGTSISESSVTEYLHNILLLVAITAFAAGAAKFPHLRGYLLMAATLFSCMFIRELDSTFDKIVHGFWVFPMLGMLVGGITLVIRHRATLAHPMLLHLQTRQATFVFIGVLMLIVFTRLFGTGSLWEPIMGADYDASYKSTIQEGLELLSYALIAYGACASFATGFGTASNAQH